LFAAFFWSRAVMQIPTGSILDRSGVSPIGRIGAILWSCGTALTNLAEASNIIGARPVALTIIHFGWRAGFWATDILIFIYFIAFYLFYRGPSAALPEVPWWA
jgi:ACS family D-galactonate transporter-like MFS transporter